MKLKRIHDTLNESHKEGKKEQLDFILSVLKNDNVISKLSQDDIKKIYDILEEILKEHNMYEEGEGLRNIEKSPIEKGAKITDFKFFKDRVILETDKGDVKIINNNPDNFLKIHNLKTGVIKDFNIEKSKIEVFLENGAKFKILDPDGKGIKVIKKEGPKK